MPRIPITIVTGFVGSGKTTLILNLIPQLRADNYKLALIKNEIGDLNVDTQLAQAAEMTGSRELLGDCICCTNVGQIQSALEELERDCNPDRVIIETSGSAEPLKLVVEINRLAKETGRYELDGVVSVIDAENWSGYASTSYTAKLQAQQTDLIIINKWEGLSERAFDIFLDRLGDLDVDTPQVKSDKGWISKDLLFGMDTKLARTWKEHSHNHDHKDEMECLSITLTGSGSVDLDKLDKLLQSASKDEVYRIKAIAHSDKPPSGQETSASGYVLNWSFGRCTWSARQGDALSTPLRMSIFTAPYESNKWKKKIEAGGFIALIDNTSSELKIERVQ